MRSISNSPGSRAVTSDRSDWKREATSRLAWFLTSQFEIAVLQRAAQLDVAGAAELDGVLEKLVHQIDDRVARLAVVLAGLCVPDGEDVAQELAGGAGMLPAHRERPLGQHDRMAKAAVAVAVLRFSETDAHGSPVLQNDERDVVMNFLRADMRLEIRNDGRGRVRCTS